MKVFGAHKRPIWLAVVMLIFCCSGAGQIISGRIAVGYASHPSNIDITNPTEHPEVPTIGAFFDDNVALGGEIMFIPLSGSAVPIVRCTFEAQSLDYSFRLHAAPLGTTLVIQSGGVSVGVGFNHGTDSTLRIFNYVSVGYIFKWYEGRSNPDDHTLLISTFEKGRAVRVAIGLHLAGVMPEGFSLAFDAAYDVGTVRRGVIEVHRDGRYSSSLVPTGDMVLPDNVLMFQLGVCYDIRF